MKYEIVNNANAKNLPGIIKISKIEPKQPYYKNIKYESFEFDYKNSIYCVEDIKTFMDAEMIQQAEVIYTKTYEKASFLAKSEYEKLKE